jgi:hypothetical protein
LWADHKVPEWGKARSTDQKIMEMDQTVARVDKISQTEGGRTVDRKSQQDLAVRLGQTVNARADLLVDLVGSAAFFDAFNKLEIRPSPSVLDLFL